ncbi:hypothetical protein MNBD_GAMMA23-2168 [hydrothermal vent metagenome]|uniref:DUF481 domain-containing protein n=1 Tax=hydrothermal vent metagenome TaxID=652676 RepID=A0A3B1A7B0_9ZZZZ
MKQQAVRVTIFYLLFLSPLAIRAGEIGLSYSSDSNSTQSSSLDISVDATEQTQLYLGAGESVIKDDSGEITVASYNIGLSVLADEQLDYGVGYSYWGNSNEISTETVHLSLSLYTEDWKFTMRPELQQIVLYTKSARRQVDINGSGFYSSVEYFGFDKVEFFYAHSNYTYNKNLTLLNTRLADLFFSNTSLLLGGSFIEKRDQAEVAFNLDGNNGLPNRIAVSYSQSLIAIDKSHSKTVALNLRFDLSKNIELELEGGEVRPEFSSKLNYGVVSLRYKY